MTPLTFQTLRLLADGEFRSGEAMARTLGVSRASIWNALHALDGTGLEIFKVHGRGYRLSQPLVWLERDAIERELGADAGGFSVEVLDLVPSTNTLLMERVAAGAPGGSVIAAEWQTQGRGRRGRVWHAIDVFPVVAFSTRGERVIGAEPCHRCGGNPCARALRGCGCRIEVAQRHYLEGS